LVAAVLRHRRAPRQRRTHLKQIREHCRLPASSGVRMGLRTAKRNVEYDLAPRTVAVDWRRIGIFSAASIVVKSEKKWVQGWRVKGWFDWIFALLTFLVFVLLEAALIYSYLVFVRVF